MAPSGPVKTVLNKLSWVLSLTRLGLLAEQLIRAFWPLWSVAFVVLAALMLGLQDAMSVELVWASGIVLLIALACCLIWGLRRLSFPSRKDALERLDSTLPGRPVQALLDQPALGKSDPASAAIWQAHQSRMAQAAEKARPPKPDFQASHLDPFGLRFVAVLLLSLGLLFGSFERLSSLKAMAPQSNAPVIAAASWEGWIEPPAYTGLPTLYLNDLPEGDLNVPVNSRLTLRLYGEVGALTVQETVSARVGEVPSAAAPSHDFTLRQDGTLEIAGDGGRLWQVTLKPDLMPQLIAIGELETSGFGEISLPFTAEDDYSVVNGTAMISLDLTNVDRRFGLATAPEDTLPVQLPLPLPITGKRDIFDEVLVEDFSDHVWAHLPVKISLQVEDAAGQTSQSEVIEIPLPARRFFDPMASALVELRRDLLWSRSNAPRVSQLIRAMSHRPEEGVFRKETDYLRLRTILRSLENETRSGLTIEAQAEIAAQLWELAIRLEEGDLSDALERMERAQERLSEAIENGASPEEIARLMQELREATQDYLRQLAQQNQNQEDEFDRDQQQAQNSIELTQQDLQAMMDRIQELMEQGRMAEAQKALEELQRMLENMEVAQGGQGEPSPGQQAMNDLGQTLQDQQGLSDEAFQQLQDQFNPNGQPSQQGQQGQPGQQGQQGQSGQQQGQGTQQGQGSQQGQGDQGQGGSPDGTQNGENGTPQTTEESLSNRQQALRRELQRQLQNLPEQGTEEGENARRSLQRADNAMEGAEEALRNNQLAEALDQQADAIDALREGMRSLGEAMAQAQGGEGGEAFAEDDMGFGTDPLGRNPGGLGGVGSDENLLQGEDVYRRARDLLDEIRRRSGDTDRSEQERDYLRRLLDRF